MPFVNVRARIRLRPGRGRLLCLLALPPHRGSAGPLAVELALVASATAPHLRRLTVLRSPEPRPGPNDAPRAA